MPTIEQIIDIAKISSYLAANDIEKSQLFNNGYLDKQLPLKLYLERKAVEWKLRILLHAKAAVVAQLTKIPERLSLSGTPAEIRASDSLESKIFFTS